MKGNPFRNAFENLKETPDPSVEDIQLDLESFMVFQPVSQDSLCFCALSVQFKGQSANFPLASISFLVLSLPVLSHFPPSLSCLFLCYPTSFPSSFVWRKEGVGLSRRSAQLNLSRYFDMHILRIWAQKFPFTGAFYLLFKQETRGTPNRISRLASWTASGVCCIKISWPLEWWIETKVPIHNNNIF